MPNIQICALSDNVIAGSRILARGETFEVEEPLAIRLHNEALATILDFEALSHSARGSLKAEPKAYVRAPKPEDPYAKAPKIEVEAIEPDGLVGNVILALGDKHKAPEPLACLAVHHGMAKLSNGESSLSKRGAAFLEALKRNAINPEFVPSAIY